MSRATFLTIAGGVFMVGLGLLAGWFVWGKPTPPSNQNQQALRLEGYKFVSPLLVCNTNFGDDSPELSRLERAIEEVVATSKENKVITNASVYFRDLNTGREVVVGANERFFPASLKKIPLMMKVYKEAEQNPSLLTRRAPMVGDVDFNANVAVPPKQAPQYGKEYSQEELIEYMIKYSDNISFQVLINELGNEKFNKVFTDLQLFYPDTVVSIDDYITPFQFSLFFRTLYNATYLSAQTSEKALKLLSETEFDDGIVAGVPKGTQVAHKFGVGVVNQQDGTARGELHDCGIVYHGTHPYLLCVMTKSEAAMDKVAGVISRISAVTYKEVEANYR